MAVLCVGDSLFKYLRINRPGSDVRFSSGARVEQLQGGLLDIKKFQVRVCNCIFFTSTRYFYYVETKDFLRVETPWLRQTCMICIFFYRIILS